MGVKWKDVTLGVSPFTNSIYIGKTKKHKDGLELWTDRSEDKTQEVLKAVMDWFNCRYKYENKDSVGITLNGKEYRLTFSVKEVRNED